MSQARHILDDTVAHFLTIFCPCSGADSSRSWTMWYLPILVAYGAQQREHDTPGVYGEAAQTVGVAVAGL